MVMVDRRLYTEMDLTIGRLAKEKRHSNRANDPWETLDPGKILSEASVRIGTHNGPKKNGGHISSGPKEQ